MRPHLRYLRYVLLHKWYVFRAGLALGPCAETTWLRWLWRLLVHDLSKFGPSEWRPYVAHFYGPPMQDGTATANARRAAFDRAWLHHIHQNPHHWQYWVLREDSGATKVLLMPLALVDEMLADWIGAGTKVLARPSLRHCIAETVAWYMANREKMQLRGPVRARVEARLAALADEAGITAAAAHFHADRAAAESVRVALDVRV